jgi:putative endonuclease
MGGRHDLGRRAELAVVRYVADRGMIVDGTNVRVGALELDIVARDGPVVAVIEVRTRSTEAWTSALGSIDGMKRARIRRAGERLWRRSYRNDPRVERMRFDAAAVSFAGDDVSIEYVRAAF